MKTELVKEPVFYAKAEEELITERLNKEIPVLKKENIDPYGWNGREVEPGSANDFFKRYSKPQT